MKQINIIYQTSKFREPLPWKQSNSLRSAWFSVMLDSFRRHSWGLILHTLICSKCFFWGALVCTFQFGVVCLIWSVWALCLQNISDIRGKSCAYYPWGSGLKILSFSPNLERLVLRCIDSYDSESRLIFSIFPGLQDPQSFAPLRSQNFRKKSPDFFAKMKLSFSFSFSF